MSPGRGDDPRRVFEELYRTTREDLLRYLVRRCRDPDEAADLLAETYLIAWNKLGALPDGDAARFWLFGVARNLVLRSARRQRVALALVDRLADVLRSAEAAAPAAGHRQEALRRGLLTLSEQDREIVMLTAWEGLAPREIAAVLGTSANVVRIRLHRARGRLKKELGLSEEVLTCAAVRAGE